VEKKQDLKELKENYKKIQEKYNLPSFENLNKDFGIEKAVESETDYLIREVRKFIADKFSNYLRFTETLLQPVNAPIFIYSMIKSCGQKEKEGLTEIYEKLAKKEIELIELDIEFNEEKEAEFIKESYKLWQELKKEAKSIFETIKKNLGNKSETKEKGYFG